MAITSFHEMCQNIFYDAIIYYVFLQDGSIIVNKDGDILDREVTKTIELRIIAKDGGKPQLEVKSLYDLVQITPGPPQLIT